MYNLYSRIPRRPELRPYVRAFAQRQIGGAWDEVVQPMLASFESIIELDFGNPPVI